jgi:hypothetical protein
MFVIFFSKQKGEQAFSEDNAWPRARIGQIIPYII